MRYNVRLKTTSENGVFELEVEEMTCINCRYSHTEADKKYHCWGDKESPAISPTGSCKYWRSKYAKKDT